MTPPRTCKICGNSFQSTHARNTLCSELCKAENAKRNNHNASAKRSQDLAYRKRHAAQQAEYMAGKRDYPVQVIIEHDPDQDAGFPRNARLPKKEFADLLEQGWITTGAIVLKNNTRYQVSGRELVRI